MLGLTSDPEKKYLDNVQKYLNWHTGELIKYGGLIPDYDYVDGKLIGKDDYDSVDAYVAKYLILLAAYHYSGGDIDRIIGWEQIVFRLMDIYDSIFLNDLIYSNYNFRVAYLMDNAEVYQSCIAVYHLLQDFSGKNADFKELSERYLDMAEKIEDAVDNRFWDPDSSTYIIGFSKALQPLAFTSYDSFYPDCVAQLYPVITGLYGIGGREKQLYKNICEAHQWEDSHIEGSTFEWAEMAYVASLFNDTERLDKYLEYYTDLTNKSRFYSMHTSNAGWIMTACSNEIKKIEQKNKSLF
jgi:hypothetical protein